MAGFFGKNVSCTQLWLGPNYTECSWQMLIVPLLSKMDWACVLYYGGAWWIVIGPEGSAVCWLRLPIQTILPTKLRYVLYYSSESVLVPWSIKEKRAAKVFTQVLRLFLMKFRLYFPLLSSAILSVFSLLDIMSHTTHITYFHPS
jgi:hypothetical protein